MKTDYSQIEGSVRRLYEAKKEKEKTDKYYDAVKKKESVAISNFIFSNVKDSDGFDITLSEGVAYYENHKHLHVTRVRAKKVIWDVKKLKEKMDKEKFNAVVTKQYTITDMNGLIRYLKSCGVDPKKFKKYLEVTQSVDEKTLDQLYNTGVITKNDISGCYEVKMSEPYIRITEKA